MTNSPRAASLAFETLEGALAALRERGLRVSAPRRLLLEALFAADGPVAAERVAVALHLDPGSVYRNLDAFERHGLVQHVHLGHGPGLYVLVGGGEREYLYCESCGAVLTLTPGAACTRPRADTRAVWLHRELHPSRDRRRLRNLLARSFPRGSGLRAETRAGAIG